MPIRDVPESVRPVASEPSSYESAPEQAVGRYIAYGKLVTIKNKRGKLKADFGIVSLRMEPVERTERGMEYAVSHWLGRLISGAFPVDLEMVRIIVPEDAADHIWFAASDCAYEYCPRYPPSHEASAFAEAKADTTADAVPGEYDGCEVVIKHDALHMSGVGYLRQREPGTFKVVGGVYDGETVTHDPATGALSHQGFVYERK